MRNRPVVLQAGVGEAHPRVFRVQLDAGQVEQLYRHASDRGLDAEVLLVQIIATIFNDNLVDAVIADGPLADMTMTKRAKPKRKRTERPKPEEKPEEKATA
jgi:hypothetical protein